MNYKYSDLVDYIQILANIDCDNCSKSAISECCDGWDAADEFFRNGWRVTRSGNVYCPDCAKKKLKGV